MYHCTVELQLRTLQAGPVHLTFLYTLTATNSSVLHAMLIKNNANFTHRTKFLQYLRKNLISNLKDTLFFPTLLICQVMTLVLTERSCGLSIDGPVRQSSPVLSVCLSPTPGRVPSLGCWD